MKKWFPPIDYEQLLYTNMFNLKQGNKWIGEYTKEFYELSIRNQVREREAQIVARYKARLQIVIQLKMVFAQTYTIGDAYQLTLVVEATLNF